MLRKTFLERQSPDWHVVLLTAVIIITTAAVAAAQTAAKGGGGGGGGGTAGPPPGGRGAPTTADYIANPLSPREKPFPATTSAPAAGFPGKRVTVKAATLKQALEQLQQQSTIQITLLPAYKSLEDKPITLEVQDKPLWQTLQAALTQSDTSANFIAGIRLPGAFASNRINSHFSASGPFLTNINRITHQVSATPGQPERYSISVSILADPTIRLSGIQSQSTPTRATDESNRSLVSTLPIPRTFLPRTTSAVNIVLDVPTAGDLPKKIALMEGKIPALFVITESIDVTLNTPVEKQIGPYTMTLTLAPQAARTQLTLKYAAGTEVTDAQLADWVQQVSAAHMELFDAEGSPLPLDSAGSTFSRRSISIYQSFPPAPISGPAPQPPIPTGKPAKARVQVPTAFKAIDIPYRFENIDLP